jgi:hypothetical protein
LPNVIGNNIGHVSILQQSFDAAWQEIVISIKYGEPRIRRLFQRQISRRRGPVICCLRNNVQPVISGSGITCVAYCVIARRIVNDNDFADLWFY